MSSRRRPSLVASLYLEGPSHECGRETRPWSRWLACRFLSPEVGAIWSSADGWLGRRPPGPMPQLEDGVRHGFEVSRFPDFWPRLGGWAYSLKGSGMCQGSLKGVEFGSLAPFFSTSLKHTHKNSLWRSVPSHWRSILVASLHFEGPSHKCGRETQVLEQMAGADDLGTRGYLADSRKAARAIAAWAHPSARR